MRTVEWSIQELAKATGTTSRTLRHYGERGLLTPTRLGPGGMRFYDESRLPVLLRILMLRQLGLGLDAIGDVLDGDLDTASALRGHVAQLQQQQHRLCRQIRSVQRTITAMEGGESLMAEHVFEGFDHTQYRQEVEQRWGAKTYADADRTWRSMGEAEQKAHRQTHLDIARDYGALAADGVAADSPQAQDVARRHVEWLGTWTAPTREYVVGLGDMYVADPRFGANYPGYVEFVRDAMAVYATRNL